VGAARIIDIADEHSPTVISEMRLAVNDAANRAGPQKDDPGAGDPAQGYAGHYCAVPQRTDPGIVACSFIISGLRVFDIHDPYHPNEIAYFNPPSRSVPVAASRAAITASTANIYVCRLAVLAQPSAQPSSAAGSTPPNPADVFSAFPQAPFYGNTLTHWAMSAPTFVPERNEVWYSDGMYGFYTVRLTNGVWTPVGTTNIPESNTTGGDSAPTSAVTGQALPRTGWALPELPIVMLFIASFVTFRIVDRTRTWRPAHNRSRPSNADSRHHNI